LLGNHLLLARHRPPNIQAISNRDYYLVQAVSSDWFDVRRGELPDRRAVLRGEPEDQAVIVWLDRDPEMVTAKQIFFDTSIGPANWA